MKPRAAVETDNLRNPSRVTPWKIAKINWLPKSLATRLFGAPIAPNHQEWSNIRKALFQGDKAMDQLVDWFFVVGARHGKALFDQALTCGVDSIENPPEQLKAFFDTVESPPDWLDQDLLTEGVKLSSLPGAVSFYVLRDLALMGGYTYFSTMNQSLARAGSLKKDPSLRLGETGKWYFDVIKPGGLHRYGDGYITTMNVRLVHALVRRNLQSKADWQQDLWGIPINQVDMLATYLAFGPVNLSGGRLFGVFPSKKESAAIMHMWRYVGWLMGVDEQFLAATEGDGLRKLYHTFLTHNCPDDKVHALGSALKNEPLNRAGTDQRHSFVFIEKLMRRYAYHKHMSNSALILGPLRKRKLGIPFWILPWYPVISALPRFLYIQGTRLMGEQAFNKLLERNRAKAIQVLNNYFNGREQRIISPAKSHPAHIQ